ACDELALAALGETERTAYAGTIIDLAATLAPSGTAIAMIGLISSNRRLKARIERLARCAASASLRAPVAAGIIVAIALVGLTDAMPAVTRNHAPAQTAPGSKKGENPPAKTVTLHGRCVDDVDSSPLAGATVRLF